MTEPVSVIISVYNNAEALKRALWGYAEQDFSEFRLIFADDGSSEQEVSQVFECVKQLGLKATHLWHEDNGFRKASILNHAISFARSPRLIFVDADVIPRRDFIANHYRLLRPGYFIAGGSHLDLPVAMQPDIQQEHVQTGELFTLEYLRNYEVDLRKFRLRLEKYGIKASLLDALFPRSNAFIGCNASCWKEHALAVNGFDEDWGYGGMDIEFGMRMTNSGVKSRRHSFSLVTLHQDHPRPYKDPEKVKKNKEALKVLAKSGVTKISNGIDHISDEKVTVFYDV